MNNPIITKALKNATNELAVNIPRLKKIILELPVSKSSEINRAKLIKDINNPHKLPIVYATNNHGKAEEILNAFIDIKKISSYLYLRYSWPTRYSKRY